MGKKVKKSDILSEIQNKINTCLEYQKIDPDPTAEKRIKMVENDPCGDLTYYVNITLKDCKPEDSVNLADRMKYIENKRYLPLLDELNGTYEEGCIITVSIDENKNFSISASGCGSLDGMVNALMPKYFDDSCMIMNLKPKQPLIGDNYLLDDINTAKETNKSSIVYAMARFSKPGIEAVIKKQFDTEKYDLYSYNIYNFYEVGYPDMTRRTAFEQNVNQFLGGGIVNSVTMFGAKGKLPDYNIKNAHGVYDMARYVVETLEEIKKCDDAQARKKYEKYSEGVFKEYMEAKYDSYKDNGGSGDWANWADAQGQFLTFKSVSSYDLDFKKEALGNGTYVSNLYACEQTADFYTNTKMECVDKSWQKETDIFKKKPVPGVSFVNNPTGQGAGQAQALVTSKLVDPPTVVVKPYCGSSIEFNQIIKHDFNVFVPHSSTSEKEAYERATLVSKPDADYERVKGYYISQNKIPIKRDTIKLDGSDYTYTDVEIVIDKQNEFPFMNEMTQEKNIYTIPPKSYYNRAMKMFFEAPSLDTRVAQSTIIYHIIPKKVTIPIKFIQHSYWENRAPADENEKKVREEYKDDFKRICVDAIPYDPWDKLIERLEKLYAKWSNVQPNKDGLFEFPPIEEYDSDELETITCKKCGEKLNMCTCNAPKLCSKCFPIDLTGATSAFGVDTSLLRASTYIFNTDSTPATFAEIAYEIYHAMFPTDLAFKNDFTFINDKSIKVILSKYETVCYTQSCKAKNSLISQINKENYERFKTEYLNNLLSSYDSVNKKFVKDLPVGLMNGILYIPIGYDITFEYNIPAQMLTLDGVPAAMMSSIAVLAKAAPEEYEKTIASIVSMYGENNIPDNLKKFMVYPLMPNLQQILGAANSNQTEYIEDYKEEYAYRLNAGDLSALQGFTNLMTIPITFSIYVKRPVYCSYPRCEDPIYENKNTDGICGLDEYFRTPLIVGMVPFSFQKELTKRYARMKVYEMRKDADNIIENVNKIKLSACDADKNLKLIDDIKLRALDALYEFGNKYKSALELVPEDPIYRAEKSSVVCAAAKKAKLTSIMDDYDKVFTHIINTVLVLKDDLYNINEQKFASIISDLSICSDAVTNYYEEVAMKSQNYNMCSEKHTRYIDDDQQFKLLNDGMVEKEKIYLSNAVEDVVSIRYRDEEIFNNVNLLGFSEDDTIKLAKYVADGNVPGVKAFVEENKGFIEAKKKAAADNGDAATETAAEKILNIQDSVESLEALSCSSGKSGATKSGSSGGSGGSGGSEGGGESGSGSESSNDSNSGSESGNATSDSGSNASSGDSGSSGSSGGSGSGSSGGANSSGGGSSNGKVSAANKNCPGNSSFSKTAKSTVCDGAKQMLNPKSISMPSMESFTNPSKLIKFVKSLLSNDKISKAVDKIKNSPIKDITNSMLALASNAKNALSKVEGAQKDTMNSIMNNSSEKASAATTLASGCKQPGEMTKDVMTAVCGAQSDNIKNQNSKQVENNVNNNNVNNNSVSDDVITTMYQFIKESCEEYKKLTSDHIQFD